MHVCRSIRFTFVKIPNMLFHYHSSETHTHTHKLSVFLFLFSFLFDYWAHFVSTSFSSGFILVFFGLSLWLPILVAICSIISTIKYLVEVNSSKISIDCQIEIDQKFAMIRILLSCVFFLSPFTRYIRDKIVVKWKIN